MSRNVGIKLTMKQPIKGDYVVATKYRDGDPQDGWCVGFYSHSYLHCGTDQRHIVVDNQGNPFRANGYRRVKVVSGQRGQWMVEHLKEIEQSRFSVWHFARCNMNIFKRTPSTAL